MRKSKIAITDVFPEHGHLPLRLKLSKNGVTLWGLEKGQREIRPADYFIDESGDSELFNKKKQMVVGKEGCSRFFIIGMMWVAEPSSLEKALDALRAEIVADTYFKKVPSVQAKTAKMFHAKDDCPEVRMQVFKLLQKHPTQVFCFVRDKFSVVDWVRWKNQTDPSFRYATHTLYDSMISSVLADRLHSDAQYKIHFAKRGTSNRTEALSEAVANARAKFTKKWGIVGAGPITIHPCFPWDVGSQSLQAADYVLWAVQRFFERGDDRHVDYVWPSIRLVCDFDDVRTAGSGTYYTHQFKQLTLAEFQKRIRRT